jgi:Zn-dependent metalloprotease
MPPHILRHVAKHGNPIQRKHAVNTLARDATHRMRRAVTQQMMIGVHPRVSVIPQPDRFVYTAKNTDVLPGTISRAEGQQPVSDLSTNQCFDAIGTTHQFYWAAFQRNSITGAGEPINATVHYAVGYDNAFWDGQRFICGDGDQVIFSSFSADLDVIAHEVTHGVTGSEINLVYEGQPGALNESVSDIFASCVKQYALGQTVDKADWLIGQGLLVDYQGQALRSLKAPGTAYDEPNLGKDPQPAHISQYLHTAEDNGGVHINSGIPNHAFYLTAMALGGHAWEKAGQIWYDVVTDRGQRPNINFATFAQACVLKASARYGALSPEKKAVSEAWKAVGVVVS